ncbi:MAG: hypothetical protein ACRDRY_22195 [Pseudonocardiaceae bacterium]
MTYGTNDAPATQPTSEFTPLRALRSGAALPGEPPDPTRSARPAQRSPRETPDALGTVTAGLRGPPGDAPVHFLRLGSL